MLKKLSSNDLPEGRTHCAEYNILGKPIFTDRWVETTNAFIPRMSKIGLKGIKNWFYKTYLYSTKEIQKVFRFTSSVRCALHWWLCTYKSDAVSCQTVSDINLWRIPSSSSPLNFPSLLREVGHTLDPSHSPPPPKKRNQWVGGFRPRFTAILSTDTLMAAIVGITSLLPP